MLKHRVFISAAAASALVLTGCEYLGPKMSQKLDLPRNLQMEKVVAEPPHPEKPEGIKGVEALKKTEIYPASGSPVGTGAAKARPPAKEGKYTLNFDDADVSEVAKAVLGDILKVNYVISPKVSGKVSLQTARPLTEDELIPTLEMVLRANGAVLIGSKGFYRIEPDASAVVNAPGAGLGMAGQSLPPGFQLRVIPLRYVSVKEMQKVIEPLLPPKAVLRADPIRNLLLVAGTAEDIEGVIETTNLFDVNFMRGMGVGLFPLKNVDAPQVAEELMKLFGAEGDAGAMGGMLRLLPIERLNAILAASPQQRYLDEVENWIERLDRYNTAKAGGVHVYRVEHVDALQLAEILGNIFGQGPGGAGGRPSVAPGFGGTQIGGAMAGGAYGTSGFGAGAGRGGTGGFGGGGFGGGGFGGSSTGLGSSGSGGTGFGTSAAGGTGTSTGAGGTSGTGAGGLGSRTGTTGGAFGAAAGGAAGAGRTGGAAAMQLANNTRIVADASTNSLIIVARAQDYKQIEEVIKELDVMPRQVLIDATIAEIALTGSLQYGIQWLVNAGSQGAIRTDSNFLPLVDPAGSGILAGGLTYYAMLNNAQNIKLLLRALAKQDKVNVLSSPSLMILNNQEGQIQVGDQVPITTGQVTSALGAGLGTVNSVQYRDTGVLLNVRPRVNAGGVVTMDIQQSVSQPTKTDTSNLDSPTIQQRQIKSTVVVKDGDTIALGGLIRDQRNQSVNGVPWLSSLPIVGPLFGTYSREMARTELVVLLTPRVVDSRRKSISITNEYRGSLKNLYKSPGLYNPNVVPEVEKEEYAPIP